LIRDPIVRGGFDGKTCCCVCFALVFVIPNKFDTVDVRLPFPSPRPFPLSNSAELHNESLLCNTANRLLVVVGGGEDNGELVINCGAA
jgi:tRNA G26 N,N-dimethylase Trm1